MDEANFWLRLEYRVCRELAGMADRSLRFLWCDGFTPTTYLLEDPVPRITGTAWICNGRKQDVWDFTLFLRSAVASRDAIDWSTLLPAENATEWLGPDTEGHSITITPSAAIVDCE